MSTDPTADLIDPTPLEVAVEAIEGLDWSQQEFGIAPDSVDLALAAFRSIDRVALARLVAEVDISWHAMRGQVEQDPLDVTMADAIVAHLTRLEDRR